ncbi:unnamed protein product [Prorocentrum cordatum]|uniref:Uncharacterized protein n=1 Tax=Prorocentrum cordatum TaxID=2364126 RepID=A0ABN9QZN0_9DINO|nr:unnamed protein product [Polarella glacialis]
MCLLGNAVFGVAAPPSLPPSAMGTMARVFSGKTSRPCRYARARARDQHPWRCGAHRCRAQSALPPCPVQRCRRPLATCVCATLSPLVVAGGALLLALIILRVYLLGAVWNLSTRSESRLGPRCELAFPAETPQLTFEEQARAQLTYLQRRSTGARLA